MRKNMMNKMVSGFYKLMTCKNRLTDAVARLLALVLSVEILLLGAVILQFMINNGTLKTSGGFNIKGVVIGALFVSTVFYSVYRLKKKFKYVELILSFFAFVAMIAGKLDILAILIVFVTVVFTIYSDKFVKRIFSDRDSSKSLKKQFDYVIGLVYQLLNFIAEKIEEINERKKNNKNLR